MHDKKDFGIVLYIEKSLAFQVNITIALPKIAFNINLAPSIQGYFGTIGQLNICLNKKAGKML